MVGSVTGGPIAALLLSLDGLGGLHGWQWLFLLEGVPAVALGAAIAALLAPDASTAAFLTPAERAWLVARCCAAVACPFLFCSSACTIPTAMLWRVCMRHAAMSRGSLHHQRSSLTCSACGCQEGGARAAGQGSAGGSGRRPGCRAGGAGEH